MQRGQDLARLIEGRQRKRALYRHAEHRVFLAHRADQTQIERRICRLLLAQLSAIQQIPAIARRHAADAVVVARQRDIPHHKIAQGQALGIKVHTARLTVRHIGLLRGLHREAGINDVERRIDAADRRIQRRQRRTALDHGQKAAVRVRHAEHRQRQRLILRIAVKRRDRQIVAVQRHLVRPLALPAVVQADQRAAAVRDEHKALLRAVGRSHVRQQRQRQQLRPVRAQDLAGQHPADQPVAVDGVFHRDAEAQRIVFVDDAVLLFVGGQILRRVAGLRDAALQPQRSEFGQPVRQHIHVVVLQHRVFFLQLVAHHRGGGRFQRIARVHPGDRSRRGGIQLVKDGRLHPRGGDDGRDQVLPHPLADVVGHAHAVLRAPENVLPQLHTVGVAVHRADLPARIGERQLDLCTEAGG